MTNTWTKTYYGDRYHKVLWYDQFSSCFTEKLTIGGILDEKQFGHCGGGL